MLHRNSKMAILIFATLFMLVLSAINMSYAGVSMNPRGLLRMVPVELHFENPEMSSYFMGLDAVISGTDGSKHTISIDSGSDSEIIELSYFDSDENEISYDIPESLIDIDRHYWSPTVSGNQDDGFIIRLSFIYKTVGTFDIKGIKKITGREFEAGDSMTFHIEGYVDRTVPMSLDDEDTAPFGDEEAPLPSNVDSNGDMTVTPTGGNSIELDFGTIRTDLSHDGSILVYKITEKSVSGRGLNIDSSEKHLGLRAVDMDDGTMVISKTTFAQNDEIVFNNVFTPSAEVSFPIWKRLKGRAWKEDDRFSIVATPHKSDTISEEKSATALGGTSKTLEIAAPASGDKGHADILLTADSEGTYAYDIVEKNAGKTIGGITYDGKKITAEVKVAKDGSGNLAISSVSYSDGNGTSDGTFENVYASSGYAVIRASKVLDGRELRNGEFMFSLLDSDGNVISKASNGANGDIVFDRIPYTNGDVGRQHSYSIREEHGVDPNISYDSKIVAVDVNIADKGTGELAVSVTYDGKEDTPSFSNAYTPPATIGGKIAEAVGEVKNELIQTGIDIAPYAALIAVLFGSIVIPLYISRKHK